MSRSLVLLLALVQQAQSLLAAPSSPNLAARAAAGRPSGGLASAMSAMSMSGGGGTTAHDLMIVGCGVLGCQAAAQWRKAYPDAAIVGETMTTARHDELRELGIEPSERAARAALLESRSGARFPYVIFCAAPSKSGDKYPDEVAEAAAECWAGREGDGDGEGEGEGSSGFIFTSSGSVYAEDAGGVVRETSPLTDAPRAMRLLNAEVTKAAALPLPHHHNNLSLDAYFA